jgi:hypothetical protein
MRWFDMAVAGPEIARVLAPGGILAELWNVMDDEVEWVSGLTRVSGSAAIGPRDTPANWRAQTADMHLPKNGVLARFGSPEQEVFPHGQRRSADCPVGTIATRARGCWPRWAGSGLSSRVDRRPPAASSLSRCRQACCASGCCEAAHRHPGLTACSPEVTPAGAGTTASTILMPAGQKHCSLR